MLPAIRQFFRSRWQHLRRDRTSQLLLLFCLITFPPAYYYDQLFLRAVIVVLVILVLVARSMARSWSRDVLARLDPALPGDVAFYRLFLVDPVVMAHVAQVRLAINLFLSLLLFNNALLLVPMDLLLGALFFFYFAGQEERFLFRQSQLGGAPVGGSAGGGFRSSLEYFLGHAQKNPKQWAIATAVFGTTGYVFKSAVDARMSYWSQTAAAEYQAKLDLATEAQKSQIRLEESQQKAVRKSQIRLEEAAKLSQIRLEEAAKLSQIRLEEDNRSVENKLRLLKAEPPRPRLNRSCPLPLRPEGRESSLPLSPEDPLYPFPWKLFFSKVLK